MLAAYLRDQKVLTVCKSAVLGTMHAYSTCRVARWRGVCTVERFVIPQGCLPHHPSLTTAPHPHVKNPVYPNTDG